MDKKTYLHLSWWRHKFLKLPHLTLGLGSSPHGHEAGFPSRAFWSTKEFHPPPKILVYRGCNPGYPVIKPFIGSYNPIYNDRRAHIVGGSNIYSASPRIMVQWKMAGYLKGNDSIGDRPIFHWTMIMAGRECLFGTKNYQNLKSGWGVQIFFMEELLFLF